MPTAWLCQIDAFARVDGAATTIRLASHDDDRLCHLNSVVWWPSIVRLPTLSYDFFDGAFGGEVVTPSGRADISIAAVPAFATLMLHGARIRWWTAEIGAAWGSFVLRFDGLIDNHPAVRDGTASLEFRVDDRWLDDPLLTTYAGTTGAEGEAALKGQVKPFLLGRPRMTEGVLIDSIDTIVQLSDGAIEAVEVAMEDAARFAAPVADYASFSALKAATIAPGFTATALAVGMIRHGAPPAGVLSYDVRGSNSGSDGGGSVRRTGAIVKRLAARAGQSARVDATALTALDTARPWNVSVAMTQQTTMREVAQSLAQSINAVALVTWTGLLTILPIPLPEGATAVGTLNAEGAGLPPVERIDQLGIASPFWRVAIEAEVTNRVHGNDEIRFTAALVDRGRYDADETYREGHIVDLEDGSRWLYTAVTPTSGNTPPQWPVTSSAFWTNLTPSANRGKLFVQPTAPTAAESAGGDVWQDANGLYWDRREDIHLSVGGNRIMVGGNLLTMVWTPKATQPVSAARQAANDAAAQAAAANAELANIASDNLLTPGEKPRVIQDRDVILAEQAGIDAGATSLGITTEKTTYDTAVSALTTYLATLTTPVLWSDLTGNTTIVGTTFRTKFSDVYTARQSLLDKIAAEAAKRANWSDIGGTGKPEDNADVTANAQIVVVPAPTIKLYRTSAGAVKPDQFPIVPRPLVTRGGVDVRTSNDITYPAVTGYGGLAGKVTVNNTTGNAGKGDVTIDSSTTGEGYFELTVAYKGTPVGVYTTALETVDDLPPINNGGAGGTDTTLATITSTTYAPMTGQDSGDPVLDVTIAAGQVLKINANFKYQHTPATATGTPLAMKCKGQYSSDGTTWFDMDSATTEVTGTASTAGAVEDRVKGEMIATFEKSGLAAGTYKVRLMGKFNASATGNLQPQNGGATSFKT